MKIPVIAIGNSKGIRLSKTILEKYQIGDSLELVMEQNCIILKPEKKARKNWEQAFCRMHEAGDDKLMDQDVFPEDEFETWS